MKTLIVASLLFGLAGCNAQTNAPESVELLEFGIFKKTNSLNDLNDGGTISGRRHAVAEAVLVERTTNIPARIGTSFGFRVKYRGQTPGAVVRCTAKCLHPKLTDPSSGRNSEVEHWDTSSLSGREEYIGYTLDNAWELVPGEWKIQLWVGPKLMVEKTFTLYAPSA
jgi:Domain of unknown function (DUF3859)